MFYVEQSVPFWTNLYHFVPLRPVRYKQFPVDSFLLQSGYCELIPAKYIPSVPDRYQSGHLHFWADVCLSHEFNNTNKRIGQLDCLRFWSGV